MRIDVAAGSRPIIALHGIQGSHTSWLPVARASRSPHDWLLPDLRGRGHAGRGQNQDDYTLDCFVQDVRAELDRLPPGQTFILAGWSLGVSIALQTCLRLLDDNATLPDALVLISGSPCLQRTHWFRAHVPDELLSEIAQREQRLGLREAAGHQDVAWTWQANRHSDQRNELHRISIPCLLIHGEQDEDCPLSHAEQLNQGLPCSTLHVLPGAGHSVLGSHTADIARLTDDFLSFHSSRTRT